MDEENLNQDIYNMNLPQDIKNLSYEQCNVLCEQIRKILIKTVSNTGGHLASNLGVVELTLAVHRIFESPKDKIVFDVGHQSYTHKILTGRLNKFGSLRQEDGISGFCRPMESEHDILVSGHSSTAVSSALGIAKAMKLSGDNHHAVAIVGDGAATGGLFFEGLNNAGKSGCNIIVIINNNEMSISKNVGALSKYLATFRTTENYNKTKNVVERALDSTPFLGKPIKSAIVSSKNAVRKVVCQSTMFENLGFDFVGPLDGHNIEELEQGLKLAKSKNSPVVVCVNTKKGKGYPPAEQNPGEFHGIGRFEITTGNPDVVEPDSFSSVFGKELKRLGGQNEKICAITAAMKYGTGLQYFAKAYKDRFFDVGIAEEHAVTFSAGLASMGYIPVFAVYSSFLQRSYDQIIHDLSISGYHAIIGVDRAGLVGNDGVTHNGIFDVSFLTSVVGITIYSPACYGELTLCLDNAVNNDKGIVAIRYPRGKDTSKFDKRNLNCSYTYYKESKSNDLLVVSYGNMFNNVYESRNILGENAEFDMIRLTRIFPLSDDVINIMQEYKRVLFFEEAYVYGSIGEKYAARLNNIKHFAITGFCEQASAAAQQKLFGLDPGSIAESIKRETSGEN